MSTYKYRDETGAFSFFRKGRSSAGDDMPAHTVGLPAIASGISVTSPVSTTIVVHVDSPVAAYTAGFVVGGLLSFANAVRGTECLTGNIKSIYLTDKSGNATAYTLLLFDSLPAGTYTDHAALSLAAADLAHLIGAISIPSTAWTVAGSGGSVAEVQPGKDFTLATGNSTLYAVLVGGTPTFHTTTDLAIRLQLRQD